MEWLCSVVIQLAVQYLFGGKNARFVFVYPHRRMACVQRLLFLPLGSPIAWNTSKCPCSLTSANPLGFYCALVTEPSITVGVVVALLCIVGAVQQPQPIGILKSNPGHIIITPLSQLFLSIAANASTSTVAMRQLRQTHLPPRRPRRPPCTSTLMPSWECSCCMSACS
jgi:hypothetical protein